MVYDLIMESGEYALILRGSRMDEYAVVRGLDKTKGTWIWTCEYYNFGSCSQLTQSEALFNALDYFRNKTEENYVTKGQKYLEIYRNDYDERTFWEMLSSLGIDNDMVEDSFGCWCIVDEGSLNLKKSEEE